MGDYNVFGSFYKKNPFIVHLVLIPTIFLSFSWFGRGGGGRQV